MTQSSAVAILGMGRMGSEMARRLSGHGFDVIVHNRTRAKAQAVASETGARVADSAAEAAAAAPTVISILADDQSVREVWESAASGLSAGTVVLEMSTVHPSTPLAILPLIESTGATLLDAPVSGSIPAVQAGNLTVMVGGDSDKIATVQPVLDVLASQVFHVGGSGAGATIKLAVNLMIHSTNVALSEALVLAEKAGVQRERAYEVFINSAAGGPYLHYKRSAFEDPGSTPITFNLDLVRKDLDLILNLGAEVGVRLDQTASSRAIVDDAIAAGMGDDDLSAVASYLRATAPE